LANTRKSSTHACVHNFWFVSGFQVKRKLGIKKEKEKNDDMSTMLLLALAIWANERADGADETTKRKLARLAVTGTGREKILHVWRSSRVVTKEKEKN
jgi:hypothetical protein